MGLILSLITSLSMVAFAKGREPVVVLDKTLTVAEVIEGVPFEAGTKVVVTAHDHQTPEETRTIAATRPGSTITLGDLVFNGDHEVSISYETPYLTTSASNIGPSETHHNIVQPDSPGYVFSGALAVPLHVANVVLKAAPAQVHLYCLDRQRTDFCFNQATLKDIHPMAGKVAQETVLDGVPALVGDRVLFQADGHPASINGAVEYNESNQKWTYHGRPVSLALMSKGQVVSQRLYAYSVTFTRHHRPSVIQPMEYQNLFGIPLGHVGSLENEAVVIRPDGSYTLSMRANSVYVLDGIPVGPSGRYDRDLVFDTQGFLTEAALGGPLVYGGILLKAGVYLKFENSRIVRAMVGGDYLRYAFDGKFHGQDLFIIGAHLIFNQQGQLISVEGKPTTDEYLIQEYRNNDRTVYPVM